jgi:alpha-glucuronidase
MIPRLAELAGALRPWGIRLHLSANFAAPLALHELNTADPLDLQVQQWWRAKADEIYDAIGDFGGFLVKANSEGQPGPAEYGRSHAEGANTTPPSSGTARGCGDVARLRLRRQRRRRCPCRKPHPPW